MMVSPSSLVCGPVSLARGPCRTSDAEVSRSWPCSGPAKVCCSSFRSSADVPGSQSTVRTAAASSGSGSAHGAPEARVKGTPRLAPLQCPSIPEIVVSHARDRPSGAQSLQLTQAAALDGGSEPTARAERNRPLALQAHNSSPALTRQVTNKLSASTFQTTTVVHRSKPASRRSSGDSYQEQTLASAVAPLGNTNFARQRNGSIELLREQHTAPQPQIHRAHLARLVGSEVSGDGAHASGLCFYRRVVAVRGGRLLSRPVAGFSQTGCSSICLAVSRDGRECSRGKDLSRVSLRSIDGQSSVAAFGPSWQSGTQAFRDAAHQRRAC